MNPSWTMTGVLQTAETIDRNGLPYWTLWLLLCIILLLLAFIFLRDKDLRQRLSFFLSGAKRRMKRTRIQMRLNKSKRKKSVLFGELGRKCWTNQIAIPRTANLILEIDTWESRRTAGQAELKAAMAEILEFQGFQEEARNRTKSLQKLKESGQNPDGRAVHEAREREKQLRREVRAVEKKIQTCLAEAKHIEFEKGVRLEALGSLADEARPDVSEFQTLYAKIDALNRAILHSMSEIENLY
jgi:hypothetical protein